MMGNLRRLGLHLSFVCVCLVTTTYTCLGVGNMSVLCFEEERLVLLKFKQSVGDPFGMLSSWVGHDCCRWERIQCDRVTGKVDSLHLRGDLASLFPPNEDDAEYLVIDGAISIFYVYYLVGSEVSSSLAKLRHLKYLDLSGNDFQGSRIPEFIGSLKQLSYLNLSNSGFHGIIPHHIGNLSNLQVLDLSSNIELIADDLAWTFGLSSLRQLNLSSVDLSGAQNWNILLYMIPSLSELHLSRCWLNNLFLFSPYLNFSTTLFNIQHLDLSWNQIEGIFPHALTNLSSLTVLNLSGNRLNSLVPIMPNLMELDLSSNLFKQIEHVGVWRQCHLKRLKASDNYFDQVRSDSPTNVSECSQYALESLDLSWSLNGTIPEPLKRLMNLRGLHLSGSGWTGPIPKSITRLRFLEILDLSHNQLTGPIPTFPRKLSKLDLSFNQLNGSIPNFFGELADLTDLHLGSNRLTGYIPASLGRLVSLRAISVNSNLLNGTVPVSVGQLSKLQSLDISNNSLEGVVSETHFAKLSMLKHFKTSYNSKLTFNISREWIPPFQLLTLNLCSCNITNGFPQWLQNQNKLLKLVLSNATITGPLPTWLRKMPIVPFLDLSHNKLNGPLTNLPNGENFGVFGYEVTMALFMQNNLFNDSIPRSLCKRKDLAYLDLSRNRLTGVIPKCLANLQNLNTMIFSSNRLSGIIPNSIAFSSSSLLRLSLNDNNFIGELPRELGNLRILEVLDLGDNKLSGFIPEWIGEKFTNLLVFRLHKNNLTGRIPQSLCNASNLQILDVAYNNLTGTIPRCIGELKGMAKRGLAEVHYPGPDLDEYVIQVMKGVDLEYTKTWDIVFNLDLSSNKLVGEIPIELCALSGLVGLNLSNNHLSGGIPDNIGNMTSLFSLDLSGNELTGIIPPRMAALNFLSHLNLSHNNLRGRIPTGNQLQTLNDPSIYVGNKDLCGPPLQKNCSYYEDPTTMPKKKHKAADERAKVWLFYVDIMSGFATGFWGVIGVLLFKKQWRWKLFRFAQKTMDRIYVAVMVRVAKMKRGREAT